MQDKSTFLIASTNNLGAGDFFCPIHRSVNFQSSTRFPAKSYLRGSFDTLSYHVANLT